MVILNDNAHQLGRIKSLVNAYGRKYSINSELIAGIIHVESRGLVNAARFEPKFYDKYLKDKKLEHYVPIACTEITERIFRATSFGLMQIMGQRAREAGFKGESLIDLCEPEVNIELGTAIIKRLLDKTEDSLVALWKYNHGEGSEYPGPTPNDYPGKVMAAIDSHMLGYLI